MTKFWLTDPTILMKHEEIMNVWPNKNMSKTEKINAISRLTIILTTLGYILTKQMKILISGILTIVAISILHKSGDLKIMKQFQKNNLDEGFENEKGKLAHGNWTKPTKNNPAMNVMLHEIHSNPDRKPAAPVSEPDVNEMMNASTKEFVADNFNDPKVDEKLFKDLGDNFGFDQSMRAWHPMPNTQIPNDQKGFADFCYGNMTSCKDGHELSCL